MSAGRKGEVIVTCTDRGHNSTARAKMTCRFGGVARAFTKTATASCTMGTELAVKAAALKLLLGSERSIKLELLEDNAGLPRRTKWRVSR